MQDSIYERRFPKRSTETFTTREFFIAKLQQQTTAVYLLAKELAYDVLNTRTSDLKTALAKTKGVDIVRFATEIENHHEGIDKKLCVHGNGSSGRRATAGKCGDSSEANKYGLRASLGTKGADKWPKISGSSEYSVDSTEKISGEMAGFNTEEKGITAGLFARTVECQRNVVKIYPRNS
ncbi:MAG: hypothetical protein AB8U44_00255 [Aaplasma endosymbiont of Hyalomma asiaticum]